MRIGIFTDTYPPFINGVSTSIISLEKALKEKGHQVFIVTVNPDDMSYKLEDENHLRIPGIPIGIYDYRLTGIYPLKAINTIKEWNLDIIHSHTEFGIGTFARIIAKQFNIPLVHTYHTMYEDYVHYITKGHFNKSSKKIVEYLTKFYCDKTARELIVPSKKTYQLFKEKYKVDKNIHIVPTGMEVSRFYKKNVDMKKVEQIKKDLGIKKDDFVILFVGRIAKEKNLEFLIDAQKELIKINKNCKLVVVGSGPDYQHFIELTIKNKMDNKIIFTNAIPWEEMPLYYQLATVFATASTTETQGLTVVEAMAASKPVICVLDPAFSNDVIPDLNGEVFNTKREYIDIINNLIKNPSKIVYMSKEAKIMAETHSLKYFAESVLDVYKAAIENKENQNWYDKLREKIRKKGLDE